MTSFDDRRDAAERRHAIDEELRFKATARRNKRTGLWAAGLLGKTGEEAEAYAKSVVLADFEEAGDEDVVRKLTADLQAAGHAGAAAEVRAKLDQEMALAVAAVREGR